MDIRRDFLPNVFTGILVLCAVIVTSLMVHQYLSSRQVGGGVPKHVDEWRRLVSNRPVNMGSDDATLKIVEFSDYQCPYCRELEKNLQKLVSQSQARVAIVRYDYPLKNIHEYAYKAAIASRCAAAQKIYEPYEAELFKANLATADWVSLAQVVNIPDVPKFSKCISTNETAPLVDEDIGVADQIGIKGTPALVIKGNVITGMQNMQELKALVSRSE